jgi:hypothetical protein
MLKCRTVDLVQHVAANLYHEVGADPEHEGVKRAVVDRAHRNPVRDYWLAAIGVLLNVRGVEQLTMPESAERTLGSIRG